MPKTCDHTSVGMLVRDKEKILLIVKKRFPFAFALPAGHVDNNLSYEEAAKRELTEEVGLEATELKLLIEGKKDNPCPREDGNWHYWKIYQAKTRGELKRSKDETKQAGFYSIEEIKKLVEKTEEYLNGKIKQDNWENSPGLEPVWYEWFKELKII